MPRDLDSHSGDTTLSASDIERLWTGVRGRTGVGRRRRAAIWVWSAALAASLLVGVSLYRLIPQERTYATATGEHMAVTLADGTQFTLASSSRLVVPADYAHGDRTVTLTGAGHFVVVHNTAHPFSVRAGDAIVHDVGTVFDVRAYAGDAGTVIAVTEGAVHLTTHMGCSNCLADLLAGDIASVSGQEIGITRQANLSAIMPWLQHGPLVFEKTPLADVLRTVERVYNVAVTVRDSTLLKRTITASFDKEPAVDVVASIAEAVGAQVQGIGRKLSLTTKVTPSLNLPPQRTAGAITGLLHS